MTDNLFKDSFIQGTRSKMRFFSPLFPIQFRLLRVNYGILASSLFLLLNGGEITVRHLETWDPLLYIIYRLQRLLTWLIPFGIVLYCIWYYGVPAFLESQLYENIVLFFSVPEFQFTDEFDYF